MRKVILVGVVMTLSACAAPFGWVKDGGDEAEFERDKARCIYEAAAATRDYSSVRQMDLAHLCMQARGYRKVPLPSR